MCHLPSHLSRASAAPFHRDLATLETAKAPLESAAAGEVLPVKTQGPSFIQGFREEALQAITAALSRVCRVVVVEGGKANACAEGFDSTIVPCGGTPKEVLGVSKDPNVKAPSASKAAVLLAKEERPHLVVP